MEILRSNADPQSPAFQKNLERMQELRRELRKQAEKQSDQGPEAYKNRHLQRGKLLASDRIAQLLDAGSPFLELLPYAGHGNEQMTPGGSIIAGLGLVNSHLCLVNANVPTIKGGALNEASVLKSLRLDEIALENRLPVIYLNESAGADLPQQAKIFIKGGASFRGITQRSAKGIPTITVVFGSSTAGGAYVPGMSDYVIMVRNQARAYLAGPPLVKMALKEDCDDEELGGAGMHARQSGLCDYLAEDDQDALKKAKEITRHWPDQGASASYGDDAPLYSSDDLGGLIPGDYKTPWDIREVIARLTDGSRFSEFKPLYGSTLITGWGKIFGTTVGILGNNGVLLSDAANKGCHFLQLCQKRKTPLIFLQNITGFMVGTQAEHSGIIKNGAKLINAVSNCGLPAITFLTGASFGAGNYGMCGRAYNPRFLFAWPNSRTAVMGPEQLCGVMEILQMQKSGGSFDPAMKARLREKITRESEALYGTTHTWDDGIIDPSDTRQVAGICLAAIKQSCWEKDSQSYGVFRM